MVLYKMLTSFLILFLLFGNQTKGANILCIFPTASYSHQQPMLALSHALAERGHNLTVITPNPSEAPIKNHREIDMSSLYKLYRSHDEMEKKTGFTTQKRSTSSMDIIKAMPAIIEYVFSNILAISEVKNFIKEVNGTNYDLMIYEAGFSSLLGFSDLIGNPPIIGLTTCHILSTLGVISGNPIIPSYMPQIITDFSDHMSFAERVENLWSELYFHYLMYYYSKPFEEKIMHKYFGNVHRKIHELEYNHSLVIVSADLSTGYPKPLQPNTIHVGPMHIRKPEPLPEDIQKWMDESEDGVIYFSLGSNMQGTSVPENIRAAFIKGFKQFPKLRVLWKWEADTKLPGQPDNVLVKKWLPQQPILAHPKLRLFISQLGLQSFSEAVYYGVPTLGIPMYGDQNFNAKKLSSSGAGLYLEFQSITYEALYEKLKDLITNQSYKENMLRLSAVTRDTPMPPVETAVWWVEYVLRHKGAPHLKPAALDLTWYQYYMFDILLMITIFVVIGLFVFYCIVNRLIKLILSLSSSNAKLSNNNKKLKKN